MIKIILFLFCVTICKCHGLISIIVLIVFSWMKRQWSLNFIVDTTLTVYCCLLGVLIYWELYNIIENIIEYSTCIFLITWGLHQLVQW